MFIRYVMESYLELAISSIVQQYAWRYESYGDYIAIFFGFFFGGIVLALPPWAYHMIHKYRGRMHELEFERKYGAINEGIDIDRYPATFFVIFFTVRRFIIALFTVFLTSIPAFQVQLSIAHTVA